MDLQAHFDQVAPRPEVEARLLLYCREHDVEFVLSQAVESRTRCGIGLGLKA